MKLKTDILIENITAKFSKYIPEQYLKPSWFDIFNKSIPLKMKLNSQIFEMLFFNYQNNVKKYDDTIWLTQSNAKDFRPKIMELFHQGKL